MTEFRKDLQCPSCTGTGSGMDGWESYTCHQCKGTGRVPAVQKTMPVTMRAYHRGCGGAVMLREPVGADEWEKKSSFCQNPKWVNPSERIPVCERCGEENPKVDWQD